MEQVRSNLAAVTSQQTALKSADGINEILMQLIGRFLEHYKLSNYIQSTFDFGKLSAHQQFVADELVVDYDVSRTSFTSDQSRQLKRMLTKTNLSRVLSDSDVLVRETVSNSIPSLRNIPLEVKTPYPLSPRNQKVARMNHLRTILKQVMFDVPNLISNFEVYSKTLISARISLEATQKHLLGLLVRHRNKKLELLVRT
jgi:hypothetical protein